MITNPKHVSEGPVLFARKTGITMMGDLQFNDRVSEVFWLEPDDRYFEALPNSDFVSAVPLKILKSKRYDA